MIKKKEIKIKEKDLLKSKLLEKLVKNQNFFISLEGSKPIKIPCWKSYRLTKKFLYAQTFIPNNIKMFSSLRLYYPIGNEEQALKSLIENFNSIPLIVFFQKNNIFYKNQIQNLDIQNLNLILYSKFKFYIKLSALLKRRLSAIQ